MQTTASLRVLAIPELNQNVFDLADRNTRAVAGRTCRAWSSPALDALYRSVESLLPLLHLLSPLRPDTSDNKTWKSKRPDNPDWDCFAKYAHRIHYLVCSDEVTIDGETRRVSSIVFKTLAFYRPHNLVLLPNLQELTWASSNSTTVSAVLLLLPPALRNLTLELPIAPVHAVQNVLDHLRGRLTGVKTFAFDTRIPAEDLEVPLGRCVQTMGRLRKVELPPFYLRRGVWVALSGLLELKELATTWDTGKSYDEPGMQFDFEGNWFTRLVTLVIETHPQPYSAFLNAAILPSLQHVGIATRRLRSASDIGHWCHAVAISCPGVKAVLMNLHSDTGTPHQGISPNPRISFQELRPLLRCCDLAVIHICSDHPFTLQDPDVREMGAAWKRMKTSQLCEDHVYSCSDEIGTSFTVLPTIADNLPNLEILGLYLSDANIPAVGMDGFPAHEPHGLKILNVGSSPIPAGGHNATAVFIGKIFPVLVLITLRNAWHPENWHSVDTEVDCSVEDEVVSRRNHWRDAKAIMKVIAETRKEAAQRIKYLTEENRLLRAQLSPTHHGA